MWKFDRAVEPPPEALRGDAATASRERLRDFMSGDAARRSQSSAPVRDSIIEESSIQAALGRLFRGKCAFCETKVECRPYPFRPSAEAIPPARTDPHLYYVWLTDAWENLYPICGGCQPREPTYFPITGGRMPLPSKAQLSRFARSRTGLFWRDDRPREAQVLLDPCENSDLAYHLNTRIDGIILANSKRGAETIEHFQLNRLDLVKARRFAFSDHIVQLREGVANLWEKFDGEPTAELFGFADLEFGGSWYLILRNIAREITSSRSERPQLGPTRIRGVFERFANEDVALHRLDLALGRLEALEAIEEGEAPTARRVGSTRLGRLEVSNFRGLHQLVIQMPSRREGVPERTALTPCLLILGENSTGKSSVLEAAALALGDGGALDDLYVDFGEMVLDPAYMGSKRARPERALVTVIDEEGASRAITIGHFGYRFRNDRRFAMAPVFAYGAFRRYGKSGRRHSRSRYLRNLFHSEEELSNPERWLLGLNDERFNEVVRRLRDILSIEGDFDVIHRDWTTGQCLMVSKVPGAADGVLSRVPLRSASSGYRAVLAMVCEIMQGLSDARVNPEFESLATARGVVLIDEIEAHLHPRWKIAIMSGLRKALPAITFIATSHDPLCLRGMEAGEVVVLRRVGGGSLGGEDEELPSRVELVEALPDMSQFRIDQLLTSDFFQLYSTDDPRIEQRIAEAAEILAKTTPGSKPEDADAVVLARLEKDVANALPVGDGEVQQLVQGAVAQYLAERRTVSAERLRSLSEDTKAQIRGMLGRI